MGPVTAGLGKLLGCPTLYSCRLGGWSLLEVQCGCITSWTLIATLKLLGSWRC